LEDNVIDATDGTVTVTSATNDLVAGFLVVNHAGNIVAGAGETSQWEEEAIGGSSGCGMSTKPGAATVTVTWASEWPGVFMGFNVNAASAGSSPVSKIIQQH
jgi:hypothetical protein